MRLLERYIRPRWQTPFETTKRVVGFAILLVGCLLFIPVPLSNVLPALAVVLLAFAYLEEDWCSSVDDALLILVLLLTAIGLGWAFGALDWL